MRSRCWPSPLLVPWLWVRNAEFCVLLPAQQFTPMIEVRGRFEIRPQDMEGFQLMPYFTVHYNKDGIQLHAVDMEAATGEEAVAEIRREIMLCRPGRHRPGGY